MNFSYNLQSTNLKEVGFAHFDMNKDRYCLRAFTSIDGRTLTNDDFDINNLFRCKFYHIESADTNLDDYDYYIAIAPEGCIFIFQDLIPPR
jgi:hypothetical protein